MMIARGSSSRSSTIFNGPGPIFVPGDPLGEVAYGQLPTAFYETIRTRWLAAYDAGKVTQVKRTS